MRITYYGDPPTALGFRAETSPDDHQICDMAKRLGMDVNWHGSGPEAHTWIRVDLAPPEKKELTAKKLVEERLDEWRRGAGFSTDQIIQALKGLKTETRRKADNKI